MARYFLHLPPENWGERHPQLQHFDFFCPPASLRADVPPASAGGMLPGQLRDNAVGKPRKTVDDPGQFRDTHCPGKGSYPQASIPQA